MPNCCLSKLKVKGDKKELKDFATRFYEKGFDAYYPHFNPKTKRIDFIKIEEWGTKWNIDKTWSKFIFLKNKFFVEFQTPWTPPLSFLENVSKLYKNLTFKIEFLEEAFFFAGKAKYENGKEIYMHEYTFKENFEDFYKVMKKFQDAHEVIREIIEDNYEFKRKKRNKLLKYYFSIKDDEKKVKEFLKKLLLTET